MAEISDKSVSEGIEAVRDWIEYSLQRVPQELDKARPGFFDYYVCRRAKLESAENGRVVFYLQVTPSICNLYKIVHGGVIASLVDIIGTAAIVSTGERKTGVSVDINVTYVSAAKLHDELEIVAKCLKVGRILAQVSVHMRNRTTGEVVAEGRHTKYLPVDSKL